MFCESCGANVPENSTFCVSCGARVDTQTVDMTASSAGGAPPPPPPAGPLGQAAPPPPPAYGAALQTAPPLQQSYAQPVAYGQVQPGNEPLSVGQYIGMFLLMCVPLLNIILLFVWGFGSMINPNRKNFARAALIIILISMIIMIIGGGALMSIMETIIDSLY
jgi:hypothetical protein